MTLGRALAWTFGVAIAVPALPAASTPLRLIADLRLISVTVGGNTIDSQPPSPFNEWPTEIGSTNVDGTGASASHDTYARQDGMGVSLHAESTSQGASALARFEILFDAVVSAPYQLSALSVQEAGGSLRARLEDLTIGLTVFQAIPPGALLAPGILTAGDRYRLTLEARASGVGSASWDFAFVVVPEPTTLALLGLGLGALAAMRAHRDGHARG